MPALAPSGVQPVSPVGSNPAEHRRQIAEKFNALLQAQGHLDITLAANAGTTTITDARIQYYSVLKWMPMTAHAAAADASMYVPQATLKNGSAVIAHTNDANTDKTFRVLIYSVR